MSEFKRIFSIVRGPTWGLAVGWVLAWMPATAAAQQDAVAGAAKVIELFQVGGLLPAMLVMLLAMFVLRFVGNMASRMSHRFNEHRLLIQQVSTITRFVIYVLTAVLVVRLLVTLDSQSMLALTGTIAVTVGFALKDLAASVLAGLTILFDRPFQVGDRVTFGGHYGEITAIGLRSVRMVTLDDSLVTIPNNKFLTDVVISGNAGALDMQVVLDLYISQAADLQEAKRITREALITSRFVYLEKPVAVLVSDLVHQGYLATRLRAKAYVLDVRYEKAFESDVTERVKAAFAKAGISPPRVAISGPTM